MANIFQNLLLESYPIIEDLPIDPDDVDEVDELVEAGEVGDTLFEFMWKELARADGKEDAMAVLAKAMADLNEVGEALARQPDRNDYRTVLREHYVSKGAGFDFDLQDPEAVESAVEANQQQDMLFSFMWRELSPLGDGKGNVVHLDHDEAVRLMERGAEEVESVRASIVLNVSSRPRV